jgi:hypothetical protein
MFFIEVDSGPFFFVVVLHFWCAWWLLSVGSTLREQPGPGPTTVGQLSPHSPSHRSPSGGVRAVSPLPKWARGITDICYVFIAVCWEHENIVEWDWLRKYIKYIDAFIFTFIWPCIVTNFLIIKPTRCTVFLNLFWKWNSTCLDSSCVHHQELFTVHSAMVYVIQVCWQLVSRSKCSSSQAVSKPVWHIPSLSVQWITPDDGQRNCPNM